LAQLKAIADRHTCVGDVRGLGLLLGLEIVYDRQSMKPDPDRAERVMYESLRRGLNFKITMGNRITLTPALTISEAELRQGLDILDQSLTATVSDHT
jgi:4-aminobutyrate aminotransferase-like enzyme